MNKKILFSALLITLLFFTSCGGEDTKNENVSSTWNNIIENNTINTENENINEDEMTVCPMDAKLCPDGETYVWRTWSNCDFEECPIIEEYNSWENNNEDSNILDRYNSNVLWNVECNFKIEEEWWTFNQTVYISWIKIRMLWKMEKDWYTSESNIISDWEYTYVWWTWWSFKMKIQNDDLDDNKIQDNQDYAWLQDIKSILGNIKNNECKDWIVDESKFELPEWVEFMDFEELSRNILKDVDLSQFDNLGE